MSVPAWPPSSGVVAVPGSRLACAGRAGDHTETGFAAAIDRLLDGMPAARDLADRRRL